MSVNIIQLYLKLWPLQNKRLKKKKQKKRINHIKFSITICLIWESSKYFAGEKAKTNDTINIHTLMILKQGNFIKLNLILSKSSNRKHLKRARKSLKGCHVGQP